ncbi:hypothetical protein WMY93_024799 [Mugilogobius chulae]|uniref:Uncharacterized protein n=1 Tax=Mugilogobius chulae TaxID=88201 RepID=A0AAW0N514_9GOBI
MKSRRAHRYRRHHHKGRRERRKHKKHGHREGGHHGASTSTAMPTSEPNITPVVLTPPPDAGCLPSHL